MRLLFAELDIYNKTNYTDLKRISRIELKPGWLSIMKKTPVSVTGLNQLFLECLRTMAFYKNITLLNLFARLIQQGNRFDLSDKGVTLPVRHRPSF